MPVSRQTHQPVILIVLDGWGERSSPDGNAILQARTPAYDELRDRYPSALLSTCGEAVGLPAGQMGNSEVGHLNIGAGRVVWQDVVRIDQTIKNNELNKNDVIMKTFNAARDGTGRLHLAGLISDGGVVCCTFAHQGLQS